MSRAKWDVILPKPLPVDVFDKELEKAARDAEEDIKKQFDDAVKFWKTPPTFRGYVRISGTLIYISVGTADSIFKFVDQGTKPHVIKAVKAKMLHWVDKDTGEDRFAKEVNHPGFEGKHISDDIEADWADGKLAEYFQAGMEIAIDKSGHAMK